MLFPPRRLLVERPLLGGTLTPERRAFESPIAIACFGFFTRCLPRFMWRISSPTYAPACVVVAFPWRLARWARLFVFRSGMFTR